MEDRRFTFRMFSLIAFTIFAFCRAELGLLVIVPDDFEGNISPLIRWKRERGYNVLVAKLSEVGSTPTQIKSFIQARYEEAGIRYCLLVGAINKIPSFDLPGPPSGVTDYLYGCFDSDLLPEVLVGRLPASNSSELDVMVAKILSYEKSPDLSDTLWFKRALMVATSYVGGSGTPALTALEVKRELRRELLASGFLRVDTVFHPPYLTGESISSAVNRGVLFVNGRGWGNSDGWEYPRFDRTDVSSLSNGFKLPVVTSFYCATGNFNRNPCFGEVWLRAGTPSQPRGGVLFFGPSYTTTSTRWNNFLDRAVYEAIFNKGLTIAGDCFLFAKEELIKNFPLPSDSLDLRIHIQTYNILGDPTLNFWRGVPKRLSVSYPEELAVGSQRVSVETGIESCLVSFYREGEFQVVSWTNREGVAYLDLTPGAEGTATLTVGKRDYLPVQVSIPVRIKEHYVGLFSYGISQTVPGQQVLYLRVKNTGREVCHNVSGILRSDGEKVLVLDSIVNFGDIPPQETRESPPLRVSLRGDLLDKEPLSFSLLLQSDEGNFLSGFKVFARSSLFSFVSVRVDDGNNGVLEPGEEARLYIRVKNSGEEGRNIRGILRIRSNAGVMLDSLADYGFVGSGEERENLDPFSFYLLSSFSGNRDLKFVLEIKSSDTLVQRIEFLTHTGPLDLSRPYGPSFYGYYAYDESDSSFPQHPVYSWVEIDPNFGGEGTRLNLSDDGIIPINLPFTFRYFGRDFNRVSVSANGYCILGESEFKSPYNWRIPSPFSPPNLLAVFWDDFRPDTGSASGVYYYYDQRNNRFVIEWSRIHHIHGFRTRRLGELQTFQILLLDSRYYPTPTGDGEIIYQYYFVQNDDSLTGDCHNYATVGLQDPSGIDYLLLSYCGEYPSGVGVLGPNRAIKFTTNPPDTFVGIKIKGNLRFGGIPTVMRIKEFNSLLGSFSGREFVLFDPSGREIAKGGLKSAGIYFLLMRERSFLFKKKIILLK
jgi:hypothetical protein